VDRNFPRLMRTETILTLTYSDLSDMQLLNIGTKQVVGLLIWVFFSRDLLFLYFPVFPLVNLWTTRFSKPRFSRDLRWQKKDLGNDLEWGGRKMERHFRSVRSDLKVISCDGWRWLVQLRHLRQWRTSAWSVFASVW